MQKINFRELLADQISGSSEDVEFCIGFAEKHQMKGDIEDAELLRQCIGILAQSSNTERHRKIGDINRTVAKSIETLTEKGCWPQLGGIAKHALEAEIECLEREADGLFVQMVKGDKVRLAVLRMGSDEFKNVFTKEFLDKTGFNPAVD